MKKLVLLIVVLLLVDFGLALEAVSDGRKTIIQGKVLDAQGRSIGSCTVDIYCNSENIWRKDTKDDGTFEFTTSNDNCDAGNEAWFVAYWQGRPIVSPRAKVEYRPQYLTDKAKVPDIVIPEFTAISSLFAVIGVGVFLRLKGR